MPVACFRSLFPGIISHSAGECFLLSLFFCSALACVLTDEILQCAFIVEDLTYFDDVYEIMMTDVNTVFFLKY